MLIQMVAQLVECRQQTYGLTQLSLQKKYICGSEQVKTTLWGKENKMKGNTNSNITKQYVDDSISALGTWEELTVTASPRNFSGTVSNFNYNCKVNRTLRLLNISFRAYMNVSARTGVGQSGITLTISGFTFPANVQVRGSSQMTKLNSLAEDSSVVGAGRGTYLNANANSNQLNLESNESYTNVSAGVYFLCQNVMIPY